MKLLDLLSLPVLEGTHVVAGEAGLERDVRWVHISDLPDMLPWVQAGQFVLTAGYAWPREEERQRILVRALAERNLAGVGLAVPHFFEHFSEVAREEANAVQLPLLEIPWDVPFARITEASHRMLLAEQYRVIERSEAIHRALTKAALGEGGLQDLAMTLSNLTQRSVTFADTEGHVLAAQVVGTEGGKSFPLFFDHLTASGYLKNIATSSEPLHIPAFPEQGFSECILCPIRLQEEQVGLVWVLEGNDALSELDVRAAEHAAIVAALHIAHQRELTSIESRFGYTFLDSLLEGRFEATPYTLERARLLGFNPDESYRVGLVILNEPVPLTRDGFLRRERLIEKLRQRLRFLNQAPLLSVSINQIPFLLPESCPGERIWSVLKQDNVTLAFGLPHQGVVGVQQSYREVLSLLSSIPSKSLYYYETLLLPRVLVGDQEAQETFIDALLGRLKQQRNGDILVTTLLTWAQTGFRASIASEQLSIHPKTLQYRLVKAAEIAALDLNDPDIRFKLQLACHLLSLKDKR
ncbi:PucR family transcriptional regulator [Tengunoibacter tsumagoiensis]|uniref:Transcriptional regulator n=1 Tax=Tengunoibacter tsumagoiensis TaxID=2014871 RepID=A0A402AA72_9CHLR|nr:PucR family transcriptional regulator [Tengunoibacter tsumagoiensis]GCE15855.1 transcriptional regulator [Tengunoibacter tsumagoiensis]